MWVGRPGYTLDQPHHSIQAAERQFTGSLSRSTAWNLAGTHQRRCPAKRALLTQEQLAHPSGVSVRTIRQLEAGRVGRPRSESLRRLADALGLAEPERVALVADGGWSHPLGACSARARMPAAGGRGRLHRPGPDEGRPSA
jgi:DNA-binding XRE family transcriptional regulator